MGIIMRMNKGKTNFLRNTGYWPNALLLLYPFFVTACFAYLSEYSGLFPSILAKSSVFNVLLLLSGLSAIAMIESVPVKNGILRTVYFFQFVFLFCEAYHFLIYDQLIGLPSIYPLIDTNIQEMKEYIAANLKSGYLIFSLAVSLPVLYFSISPVRIKKLSCAPLHAVAPALTFSCIAAFAVSDIKPYLIDYNPIFSINKSVFSAIREKARVNQLNSHAPSILPGEVRNDDSEMTHILIISESINRNHMSLYGYGRNTSPHLTKMSDQLFVQQDTCSSRNTTIPALQEMLTFATREDRDYLYSAPNLIQLMKAAGFATYWVSNQQEIGEHDSFLSVFSSSADHKLFTNRRGWNDGVSHDEKLLLPVREILKNGVRKKFIIIHLIGAHARYDLRYPESYNVFHDADKKSHSGNGNALSASAMQTFNQYDNAVLYNDFFTSRMIEMQDRQAPVTLSYISDHGEAINEKGEFFGHAENLPYRSINEIPAFFWISDSLKISMNKKITALKENLHAPFQSDQTIHTLLSLYNVKYKLLDYKHSLFDTSFTRKLRYCDSLRMTRDPKSTSVADAYISRPAGSPVMAQTAHTIHPSFLQFIPR